MKKVLFKLFILLYIFSINISTTYAEKNNNIEIKFEIEPKKNLIDKTVHLNILAESAILMDSSTGEILYEKNMNEKLYPASITKLMTVLLALEYGKLDDIVTFSKEAVFGIERNSSHIAIDVGEQLTLEQCLYAILLQSANEVSLGVAEHIGGSNEIFSEMMNKRAKELGCLNTNFVNPNGLHNDNHYTSAYDMALISKEVLKFDKFREILSTLKYDIPPTNKQKEVRHLYAQHQMIKPNSIYLYEGCEGGKTGFTDQASNTLVTYAKKDNTELIAVVLKDIGSNTYIDTKTLFDYGFENYKTLKIFSADEFHKKENITQTYKNQKFNIGILNIKAENDIYMTAEKDLKNIYCTSKTKLNDFENIIINKNDVVGKIDIYYEGNKIGSSNLIALNTIVPLSHEELKSRDNTIFINIIKIMITIFIVLIIILMIITIIIRKRNNKLKQKRKRLQRRKQYNIDNNKIYKL